MHPTLTRSLLSALLLSLAACGASPGVRDDTSNPGDGGPPPDAGTTPDGGTPPDAGTTPDGGTLPNPPLGDFRNAIITYYDATGAGHCSFPASPEDMDVVALTQANLYENGRNCGACIEVEGPLGKVVVRVVDSCPECGPDHLDLSREAFAKVAHIIDGRVSIRWRYVACNVQGPVQYHVKEGSSQWWTAVQVRNHRLPLERLEWLKDGAWVSAPREHYNYFVEAAGMGTGPIRIRVTATDGQSLEDTLPGPQPDTVFQGSGQFAPPSR